MLGMQRHHLLPRQLISLSAFSKMFDAIGWDCIGFDDFRANGMLLPAMENGAMVLGLPLHRGPHRHYNEMVAERVGQIESGWARARCSSPDRAAGQMLMRFDLLQRALRRRLLDRHAMPLHLNSKDPWGNGLDFSDLDAMADSLWASTDPFDHQT